MTVNNATIDLIKEFEGFIDHWYPDPATGAEPWTAMYGHTNAAGDPKYTLATKGRKFTQAEGEAVLRSDLESVERTVQALVKVPLTANQYGALVSFTFNLGAANLGKSTLLKKLNAKDYSGATREFAKWDKAAGKTMAGLTRRRAAEASLFMGGGKPADLGPIIPPPPIAPIPTHPAFPQPDVEPIDTPAPQPKSHKGLWLIGLIVVVVLVAAAIFTPIFKG